MNSQRRDASAKSGTPVSLDTVDYNPTGDIVFSGSAAPGSAVRVYVDNRPWAMVWPTSPAMDVRRDAERSPPGGHSLRVDQIDGGGKVLSRIELPFVREEAARVAEITKPEAEPAGAGAAKNG